MIAGTVFFAARRMLRNPWTSVAVVLALAAAGALIGWGNVRAAEAQEKNVRDRLEELRPAERSFQVTYFTLPFERDVRARPVATAMRSFADVGQTPRRVRIWHSLDPNNPRGTRLVVVDDPAADVRMQGGRLPAPCRTAVCDAVALSGTSQIGDRVQLRRGRWARIVGRGSLRRGLVADPSDLDPRALLFNGMSKSIAALAARTGSTVVSTTFLDPGRVHGYALEDLRRRLSVTMTRLEFGDDLLRARAPLDVLERIAQRGDVARKRLLIVSGECAVLVLAFSAFVATSRRREAELADQQLTYLGATRAQTAAARIFEYLTPGLVGASLALLATWIASRVVAANDGLPSSFVRAALPWTTIVAVVGTGVVGAALLVVSLAPRHRRQHGVGAVEVAALTAFALLVWQASTTGALQPEDVARRGAEPIILLLPALAFFVTGVAVLRAVPFALRLGERASRRAPLVRVAFVTAARMPLQTAAATTFLAVALGASLFSLDYLATIDRQARDAAQFAVGAPTRVLGPSRAGADAIRLVGEIRPAQGNDVRVRVLALPAARVPDVLGWRRSFAKMPRQEIAHRLRPNPVRLEGPPLAPHARALRVFARSRTDFPRLIVLRFLLPRQRFAQLTLGVVWRRWRLLQTRLPKRLEHAQLVAVEYRPTKTPISFKYDPEGVIDLGPLQQRTPAGWVALRSLGDWTATTLPTGTSGIVYASRFRNAPVRRGLRFEVNGTFQPLIHPTAGLPPPLPGFMTGPLPALVSKPIAARAVDGLLTLTVAGKTIPVRVVATSRLFPTIVGMPTSFVLVDYDTLFAALNADQPGAVTPNEAWFFGGSAPSNATLVATRLERRLRNDPLAAGTRGVLAVTAVVGAVLALLGLVLAARSTASSDRPLLAEYEALGVEPRSLRRSAQIRMVALSALGVGAGLVGGLVAIRLIGAFVAVTGTAQRPLPPIVSTVAWKATATVVVAVVAASGLAAGFVAARALRGSVATRLRA